MERHHLPHCLGTAPLPRRSSPRAGARELCRLPAPACPWRAHLGKTPVSLAPAPPAPAPAWPAEAEEHWPDPAVGNHSPLSWAEGSGTWGASKGGWGRLQGKFGELGEQAGGSSLRLISPNLPLLLPPAQKAGVWVFLWKEQCCFPYFSQMFFRLSKAALADVRDLGDI